MTTRTLPTPVTIDGGRRALSWHPEPYLSHTILPVHVRAGAQWAAEYRVHDRHGRHVATFSRIEYARRAIRDRVDVLQIVAHGYPDLDQYL